MSEQFSSGRQDEGRNQSSRCLEMIPKGWFCPPTTFHLKCSTPKSLSFRSCCSATTCTQLLLTSDTKGTESPSSEASQCPVCVFLVFCKVIQSWLLISLYIYLIVSKFLERALYPPSEPDFTSCIKCSDIWDEQNLTFPHQTIEDVATSIYQFYLFH